MIGVSTEVGPTRQRRLARLDKLHSESQASLTRRSDNAKQIIAEDSGHYVQVEKTELVRDAIRQVVEAARNSARL